MCSNAPVVKMTSALYKDRTKRKVPKCSTGVAALAFFFFLCMGQPNGDRRPKIRAKKINPVWSPSSSPFRLLAL
jgi:hypothetical protein